MDRNVQGIQDVIVVGGGVNGLVAAAYLAKAGRNVQLFEKKDRVGGIAVTETLLQQYAFSSLVDGAGYLSPAVISDLNLQQYGLEMLPVEPVIYALQPDGINLEISSDVQASAQAIAQFSEADAAAYPSFVERMAEIAAVVEALLHITPPDLPDVGLRALMDLLPVLKPVRKMGRKRSAQVLRVLPMSVADLLDEWFESDVVKGAIGASAILNSSWGPQEAGTGYSFFYNWACSSNGLFRSSGNVKGGMGALSEALARAARPLGVDIQTSTAVEKISVEDNVATGVQLENGDHIRAGTIVSAVDMNTTFLKLTGTSGLDQPFVKHLQNIKYRGSTARVHYLLTALPEFKGLNGDPRTQLSGHVQIAPSLTYLQKAFDPIKYGRYSRDPYLDIFFPTLSDSSLISEDLLTMSVTVKYVPYHLRSGNWDDLRDDLVSLVVDKLEQYAPGFAELVQDQVAITPLDLERDYDLPEGSLAHGEMSLDQFLWMRPVPGYAQYKSPLENLFICSAATHPGGGVTGINGKNAAREILK